MKARDFPYPGFRLFQVEVYCNFLGTHAARAVLCERCRALVIPQPQQAAAMHVTVRLVLLIL